MEGVVANGISVPYSRPKQLKNHTTRVGGTGIQKGSVAASQKSCRDWIKQTKVFIVDSFYCFVSIVSRSIVSIQLD